MFTKAVYCSSMQNTEGESGLKLKESAVATLVRIKEEAGLAKARVKMMKKRMLFNTLNEVFKPFFLSFLSSLLHRSRFLLEGSEHRGRYYYSCTYLYQYRELREI